MNGPYPTNVPNTGSAGFALIAVCVAVMAVLGLVSLAYIGAYLLIEVGKTLRWLYDQWSEYRRPFEIVEEFEECLS
jgi:hypothetical protein